MSKKMRINKKAVHQYLVDEPRFRERSNRERGIVNLLIKKYPVLAEVPKDVMIKAVHDFSSMDRSWRKILEETPKLRGTDYGDKESLEKLYQAELGYKIEG